MRRPGRRAPGEDPRSWYAVDTVRRTWVRGSWRTAEDLLDAAHALGVPLSRSDEDAEPMVLVCTHATRDACCAVRGRPIVATLARALPEEVWECTHLGGHRFAGTLLSLPDGACFGRLEPGTAVDVVTSHRRGHTDPTHLRGTTRWEPAVQAALVAALAAHRPASADDAVPGIVDVDGDHTMVEVLGRDSTARAGRRRRGDRGPARRAAQLRRPPEGARRPTGHRAPVGSAAVGAGASMGP